MSGSKDGESHPYDPYPMDFSKLQRGDVLQEDEIKALFDVYPEKGSDYATMRALQTKLELLRMRLADDIAAHFRKERGIIVKVKHRGGALVILEPQDQDVDCSAEYGRLASALRRNLTRDLGNDASQLTDEQVQNRQKRLCAWSWRLQQLRKPAPPALTDNDEGEGDDGQTD